MRRALFAGLALALAPLSATAQYDSSAAPQARPTYPEALFAWLASLPASRKLAVDVGAGSGQATLALAQHFKRVIGTDSSASQLRRGQQRTGFAISQIAARRTDQLRDFMRM